MNVLETLLNRRWILKSRDKELYYQVKDQLGTVKKFLSEKAGYQLYVNPYLIKVEKMPAKAKPWMGIQEFNHQLQYAFLCMILMFLEDKEAEEQFVLSELTEYIQGRYKESTIDWTSYTCRRHLIRVIKYCVACGMFAADDGNEEDFAKSYEGEVLYENTGVSRYFMRNFTRNIMEYSSSRDFEADEWIDLDTDRGIARRQRVYRKLLMSMGMDREADGDEDFAYVRNYRNMIGAELEEMIDCELQVHRNSAFLIIGENGNLGRCFPADKTLSDIVLLFNQILLEELKSNRLEQNTEEVLCVSERKFEELLADCKGRYGSGFIKTYREMTTREFQDEVKQYMEQMDLITVMTEEIYISQVAGKIAGHYPVDFKQEEVANV